MALLGVLLARYIFGADTAVEREFAVRTEKRVALQWHFRDEWRVWLSVNGYGSDFKTEGYHPSFTYIVSDYVPVVKKIGNRYQISFRSEIATGIP